MYCRLRSYREEHIRVEGEEELSNEWKKIAYETFKDVPIAELRTAQVQVKLKVGYSLAIRIKNWLKTVI